MTLDLTPAEEHYLKRELLKQELVREIEGLDDPKALRRFGYPFSAEDPRSAHSKKKLIRRLKRSKASETESDSESNEDQGSEFPLLSHFLQHFVMKLPLLAKDLVNKEDFWQEKVQLFFEHFMEQQFSSSFDREELTKRKRLATKLSKMVLLMYNSGIGCKKEVEYFEQDKFELEGSKRPLKQQKLDQFVMPSKESLRYLLTEEPYYINGWDFNVMAAVSHKTLNPEPPAKAKASSSSGSKWMKTPAFLSPSSLTSPSKFFSRLTMTDSSSEKGEYIFVTRIRQEGAEDAWFINKKYSDFKRLVSDLNKEFPGKELPKLPHQSKVGVSSTTSFEAPSDKSNTSQPSTPREKIVSTFSEEASSLEAMPDEALIRGGDDDDDFQDAAETVTKHLPREKLRTSLRKFLRVLVEDNEVAQGVSLKKFVRGSKLEYAALPPPVLQDMKSREAVDVVNLENQIVFQKLAFEQTLQLQNAMKEFKTSVLEDEDYLLKLFQEIKVKDCVEQLSPALKGFMGWCRINLSATIYQTFLGNDGGYELFTQVKRLHRLLPYTVMIQILKITNPMAIMKGMMDLFMARPFGGNSLLQNMFSSVLSDDLKSQLKLAKELEESAARESNFGSEVSKVLASAIFDNEDGKLLDMQAVHDEAVEMNMPLAIVLAMKCNEKGYLSHDALGELIESYSLWKTQENTTSEALFKTDSSTSIEDVPGLYFSHIKSLLQIYIRERDKRLMKQIWQDPELSQLLKSIVALFYEPMVRIFRVSRMDVAFRNFERFMNDLVSLLDGVINGRNSFSTSFNVVDAINKLVEKHENSLYQFIHEICMHDTEKTFEGMITYLTSIVKFLQKSKYGQTDRLDLSELANGGVAQGLDTALLKKQLAELVSSKEESRKLYQKLVDAKTSSPDKKSENLKEAMERKWKESNEAALPETVTELGLQDGDLVDLDLDVGDYAYLDEEEQEALQQEHREILDKKVDLSEVSKMVDVVFKDKLKEILKV
ncbi:Lec1p [Lachancea thermotolerans CBS 6340]|uniref:KLTH0F10956p n=1 Tax=Lachancea thermotolerans (strain ATCC 56472 / CBS 6340 / NRRL Y-8284) TaxID=559295 RepID=C5DL90_LACTC|nr:KLTH0F10956p [Lachancea thermotolerans CBS 6340]CAR24241.1 KLTH0F10956p [Lachancea thermotolerans CBS 6340]